MEDGSIVQQGVYSELMESDGPFATLMRDFGGVDQEKKEEEEVEEEEAIEESGNPVMPKITRKLTKDQREARKAAGTGKELGKLIVQEKRDVGSIKSSGKV